MSVRELNCRLNWDFDQHESAQKVIEFKTEYIARQSPFSFQLGWFNPDIPKAAFLHIVF